MNAIEKLRAERQRLVSRMEEIDNILGQFDNLQKMAESYFAEDTTHTLPSDSATTHAARHGISPRPVAFANNLSSSTKKAKTPMAEFESAVVDVLSNTAAPLDRSALYEGLQERSIVIGSPDRSADLNTLSARMSRLPRLKEEVTNVPGLGYWLKVRALPTDDSSQESADVDFLDIDL